MLPDDVALIRSVVTLVVVLAAIVEFARERRPPDVTALLAMLLLMLAGVLTPEEAFAGFSHPATVSVAAMLVLSAAASRTGALAFLVTRVLAPLARSELLLMASLMVVAATLSAFVVNTAAVAVFIPIVLETCRRTGVGPGRLLMPMAHAATFGGLCTLIGTSTNIVAHEFAVSRGLPGFSMFELGRVGLPMLVVGFAYMLTAGRIILPRGPVGPAVARDRAYLSEIVIQPGSVWIGRPVSRDRLQRDYDIDLLELSRQGKILLIAADFPEYAEGDCLRVRGPIDKLMALAEREGLELSRRKRRNGSEPEGAPPPEPFPLMELVLLPSSPIIGRTLKEARFAELHDAVVVAFDRPGMGPRGDPADTALRAGDVLVVEGPPAALDRLAGKRGFMVIGAPELPHPRSRRVGLVLAVLVLVVAAVAFDVLPVVMAATAGCAVLMIAGCLRPREAYQAIDLGIVFTLAGALAMGRALEKVGVTTSLASFIARTTGASEPFVALAMLLVVALVTSEIMSNSGTVALLAPVAVSSAHALQANPMAFLAAVTFGASAAFALPMGYQTSLMIYGPGGYRIRDFLRIGIPLDIMLAVLALTLIPQYWPLVP